MKRLLWTLVVAGVAFSMVRNAGATDMVLPDFLPEYYTPAFEIDGVGLNLLAHSSTNQIEQWQYGSADQSLALTIELVRCDSAQATAVFNNLLGYLNVQTKEYGGSCYALNEHDACVTVTEPQADRYYLVYRLPQGIQVWTYSVGRDKPFSQRQFDSVLLMVNRHRYEDALKLGNVELGRWGNELHDYATVLLQTGQKKEAVKVLGRVVTTSPYNYDAHLDFLSNTGDTDAATNSARIIADNAEDEELVGKAETFLGIKSPSMESLPLMESDMKGLQTVLISLPPCDVRLLQEVAEIYRNMTGMPVKICRLKEDWEWAVPERFGEQRTIERLLVQVKGEKVDFTGWTKDKYKEELRTAEKDAGALSCRYMDELIGKMDREPGQYRVDGYLAKLCGLLEGYCSNDKRTMYVGVTEANIYSDNNNYVFSQGRTRGKSLASVLSYHMMQASVLGEDYEFRPRLAERLAKELVPASLKQLGIPRSTDPRCPYSYSSGVSRLDEKTLKLSQSVKDALQKFKEMP